MILLILLKRYLRSYDNNSSREEKDQSVINIMLKYKVVDDKTVRNLVKYKKINIKNIDSILDN